VDDKAFNELLEAVREAGAYLRGEIPPERLEMIERDGIRTIRIKPLNPDRPPDPPT
jgi:hypothetical protein